MTYLIWAVYQPWLNCCNTKTRRFKSMPPGYWPTCPIQVTKNKNHFLKKQLIKSIPEENKDAIGEEAGATATLIGLIESANLQIPALKVLANLSESGKDKKFSLSLSLSLSVCVCINTHIQLVANHKQLSTPTCAVPLLKTLLISRNISLLMYILYIFKNITKTRMFIYHLQLNVLTSFSLTLADGKDAVRNAHGLKIFVRLLKTYKTPQVLGPVLIILSNLANKGKGFLSPRLVLWKR